MWQPDHAPAGALLADPVIHGWRSTCRDVYLLITTTTTTTVLHKAYGARFQDLGKPHTPFLLPPCATRWYVPVAHRLMGSVSSILRSRFLTASERVAQTCSGKDSSNFFFTCCRFDGRDSTSALNGSRQLNHNHVAQVRQCRAQQAAELCLDFGSRSR